MGKPRYSWQTAGLLVLSMDEVARLLQGRYERVLTHKIDIPNLGAKRHERSAQICGVAYRVVATGLHKYVDGEARVDRLG